MTRTPHRPRALYALTNHAVQRYNYRIGSAERACIYNELMRAVKVEPKLLAHFVSLTDTTLKNRQFLVTPKAIFVMRGEHLILTVVPFPADRWDDLVTSLILRAAGFPLVWIKEA